MVNRDEAASDDTVAERVEAALAEVGFHFHRREPWRRGESSVTHGKLKDGGRTVDWRIADLLREVDTLKDKEWRLQNGLIWLGQVMNRQGTKLLAPEGWQGADNNVARKARMQHLLTTALKQHGLCTSASTRGVGGLAAGLRVGQFALANEVRVVDGKAEVGAQAILVQGIDKLGGNGTKSCQACRNNTCSPGNHDAMQPQVVDGYDMLVVREWVRQEMTGEGEGLTGVYINRGQRRTLQVHLTGRLLSVSPRLVRRNDGEYATVWADEERLSQRLIAPREGTTATRGVGVTRRIWESHTQSVEQAWQEKGEGTKKWKCEV